MPRIARIVGVQYPHHIVQRGNNREKVFLDPEDFKKYLFLLQKYSKEREARILAYCLMGNHVHLLIRPMAENTLFKMMQGVALCYTQYFNRRNGRTGRIWECRYHSSVIDEDRYLWAVSRYIEKNPVRAKVVRRSEEYPYSSAKAHLLGKSDPLLGEKLFMEGELSDYKAFMKGLEDSMLQEEIRRKARLGRPLGDGGFSESLLQKLGRNLTFRPRGRPRKKDKIR